MIKISKDILDSKTHTELNNICEDFDNGNFKNINYEVDNNYVRTFVDSQILKDYIDNSKDFLTKNLSIDFVNTLDFDNTNSWINKVATETNKNDTFHKDRSFLTLVTYLNEEFDGGEFQYIDEFNNKKEINPEKGMTLIMNDKLLHRVMPVNNGVRFSLVTFFNFKEKKNKSLL
jgi:predicted 2-oxoglutarate/Fe(II)-dependent dioxygenase YbiX